VHFSAKKIDVRTYLHKIHVSAFPVDVSKIAFFTHALLPQLCTMAKEKEKQIAQTFYIEHCLTAKEISLKINVSEKTIGSWVDKGNWRELRLSKQTTPDTLTSKYNELLTVLLEKRIRLEKKTEKRTDDENSNMHSIIDEMSKLSAMIERLQTDGKASLRTHIHCLEKFMASLHQNNPKLFMQLIDFQKEYFTLLAEELK